MSEQRDVCVLAAMAADEDRDAADRLKAALQLRRRLEKIVLELAEEVQDVMQRRVRVEAALYSAEGEV